MKVLVITPNVLITPEGIDHLVESSKRIYQQASERAAMRGGMMDAAALCDKLATEMIAQNRRGNRMPRRLALQMASAFSRCGDEIMRMRDRVEVPKCS